MDNVADPPDLADPSYPPHEQLDLRPIVRALMFIFWGALLLLIDFNVTWSGPGGGFRLDFVNDVLGAILIAVGVFRLNRVPVDDAYEKAMWLACAGAVLGIIETFLGQFRFRVPDALAIALAVAVLLELNAMVAFCRAMRRLSRHADLPRSAGSWYTTYILFMVIYVIPLGLLQVIGLYSRLTGSHWNLQLDPVLTIVLVVIGFAPVIHLLVSTRRMAREAGANGLKLG